MNRDATHTLQFELNGASVEVPYDEGETLLDLLRGRLGLTSAKNGCAPQGQCGACTVLVDGKALMACHQHPERLQGRSVVTLEAVPEIERRLLSTTFSEAGAMQCGFCIPGLTIKTKQLLDKNPQVSREKIARSINANICRCTGYIKILDGIELAAKHWANPSAYLDAHQEAPSGVGQRASRYRGADLTLGDKDYVDDMKVEGLLHGALVFSDFASAVVEGIDISGAEAFDTVEAVLTAADVPGARNVGLIFADWPLMVAVGERTRCVGDVLAVVVATDARSALRAAAAVSVSYSVETPITTTAAAMAPDAAPLHPDICPTNVLEVSILKRGDLAAAEARSAHIVAHSFRTQRIEHAFIEPESALATPEGEGVRVYSGGQGVHEDQRQIASMLGLPKESVQVTLVSSGGGFGGKEDLSVQGHAALAAYRLGRPVRITLDRDESIRMHPKRHPLEMDFQVGADAEGHLTFVHARLVGDTGAYASVGTKVLERAAGHACGPYRLDAVDIEARTVYTNNVPSGAFRGFGVNQTSFAMESILDILAEKIGVDGYDIRERNILHPGEVFATGQILGEECGIRQTLEAVKDAYKNARYAGIACGIKNTGIGNGVADIGRAVIDIPSPDTLVLYVGFTEMGQGLFTVVRQILCEETGLDPALVRVETSTDFAVECGMTTASRATVLAGTATRRAAEKLAAALAASPTGLAGLTDTRYYGEYICDFTTTLEASTSANPVTHLTFGYATQVVLLDDEGKLERVIAAHDVGRAINPTLCEGQIEGGVVMGLGFALTEDLPLHEGAPISTKINDLGLFRAKHTPPIEVILIEVPDPIGPYGAKGVGEIGLVPTAGAVAGALYAFDGVRRFELPMKDSAAARAILGKR